ncbi:MAG: DUF4359 domain-containing protein [Leptolyngbyaceae cyanobacterium]
MFFQRLKFASHLGMRGFLRSPSIVYKGALPVNLLSAYTLAPMKTSALIGLLLLAIVTGGLVLTNPQPDAYELYAQEQAEQYLSNEVCNDLLEGLDELFSGAQCGELVQTFEPTIQALIRERTQRLNLGVASIYRTTFGIAELPMLPSYQVETVGIFGKFITYRATQVQ